MEAPISADPTILYGGNAPFIEGLFEDFLADPLSVEPEWRRYFETMTPTSGAKETAHSAIQRAFADLVQSGRHRQIAAPPAKGAMVHYGSSALITAYRALGHLRARMNPLHLRPTAEVPELEPAYYGLSDAALGEQVTDGGFSGTLKDVLAAVDETYCGSIGFEYLYLPRIEREWVQGRIEANRGRGRYDAATRRRILDKLTAAEGLERYLHTRFVGQKRFSLEGGDTLIPMIDQCLHQGSKSGVREVVIGMAHRGRLNVLVNTFGKKSSDLFAEFEGKKKVIEHMMGDVKYHSGFSSDMQTEGGNVHLSLAYNPSHLEIVNPVIEGSVRARQDLLGEGARDRVLPLLIHGDAAVIGQGVVAETLNLSQLRGFATGGTLHLVINNQVGFTISDERDSRSSRYCTDIGKVIDAPVFHVNGDDPEAAVFAMELALDYRQAFHKDVFIDLVCFRRHGHNESDEPRVTQPVMYREIDQHPGTRALYAKQLEAEGVLKAGEGDQLVERYRDRLDAGEVVADGVAPDNQTVRRQAWSAFLGTRWTSLAETGSPIANLKRLGERLTALPEGFTLHPRVEAILKSRRAMTEGTQALDWGFAENLAYASLLTEGFGVRITGQDVGRGTFFHRHAVLHNQADSDGDNRRYVPLAKLQDAQAPFELYDSTLSEEAVLAFEYGYAATEPNTLVVWEAQYGDFANGAQVVIDQFVASGETKWQRLSSLVMLLPHGFEGQGPEHSSARLERYLQLCAEENMQVCVPSTPAQMFHMLRRQMLRPYRKPLVVMSPKSLLRHKASVSPLEDLADGRFQEIIGEERPVSGVDRVVLSSGKLYFELLEARAKQGLDDSVALVRVEQLYPFPEEQLRAELAKYPGATVVWAQEEPENMGAWTYLRDDLERCLGNRQSLERSARPRAASPAVGYPSKHTAQQQVVIDGALGLQPAVKEPVLHDDQRTS